MQAERQRDWWFKAGYLALCAAIGGCSAWYAIVIGQARLEERMKVTETNYFTLSMQVETLKGIKLDRADNLAADDAQDKRIADIKAELDSIHADIRTLLVVQARGR